MTDEPMTGDCFDEEHDPLSDCLEHYTKLQKEYDALKAKLEYAEARIALLSRLGDGSDEAIAQRDAKIADIEASQTRWVKCSERMPTIVNQPEFAYITIVHVKSKQEELLSMGMVLCDLQDGKLIPAGPGFLPLGWEVVAWLGNVPRYEP